MPPGTLGGRLASLGHFLIAEREGCILPALDVFENCQIILILPGSWPAGWKKWESRELWDMFKLLTAENNGWAARSPSIF